MDITVHHDNWGNNYLATANMSIGIYGMLPLQKYTNSSSHGTTTTTFRLLAQSFSVAVDDYRPEMEIVFYQV